MAVHPPRRPDGGGDGVSPRLLNEKGAAQFLSLSVPTLRRMRRRRARGETGPDAGPPFVTIFSCIRYDTKDLNAYADLLPRIGGGAA